MPKPGWKSVSLPADEYEAAERISTEVGYRTAAEFIRAAIREKVERGIPPTTPSEPAASVPATTDLPTSEPQAAVVSSKPADRRGRSSGSKRDVEIGRESGVPVQKGAPSRQADVGTESAVAKPIRDVAPIERPQEPIRPLETWTPPKVKCPRCGKLVETTSDAREAHFKICPPTEAPRPAFVKIPRGIVTVLERYIKRSETEPRMRDRLEASPRSWLVGMLQLAFEEKGLEIPDDEEASRMIDQLAKVEDLIKQALEK